MSFLAPLFLAGLAALAVPVIVHLTHRQRKDVVRFPSLSFLEQVPFRAVKRQRIRDPLLFLLRVLAILLIVAAFARPILKQAGLGPSAERGRDVVVLLDRSYSMGAADRWSRARGGIDRVLDGLQSNDRVALVLFDEQAEVAASFDDDRALLRTALDGATPGVRGTRLGPALQIARQILNDSPREQREVVLVSDFPAHGWDRTDDLRLPAGVTLTPVDLALPPVDNAAVSGVTLTPGRRSGRNEITVAARVLNLGRGRIDRAEMVLEVEGTVVERRTVRVDSGASATVSFAPVPAPPRATRADVRLASDALAVDNQWNFVLAPARPVTVMLVRSPDAGEREMIYLRQAFAVGTEPAWAVTVRAPGQVTRETLAGVSLVVWNDAVPPGGLAPVLRSYLGRGGALLVVLGRRSGPWPAAYRDLLPGTWRDPVDRPGARGGTLAFLDYDHAALARFRLPRSGDFASASFFRYRQLRPDSAARVLARLDDNAPILAERPVGEGRVLVWTSSLDNTWNDFPIQPVFVPVVHELARYLSRFRPAAPWYQVGQVMDLAALTGDSLPDDAGIVLDGPGEERVAGPLAEHRAVPATAAGFYTVREREARTGRPVAVNVDVAESDPAAFDPAELVAAATVPEAAAGGRAPADAAAVQDPRRQQIWWYLLIAGLLVLAAEAVLAGRTRHVIR